MRAEARAQKEKEAAEQAEKEALKAKRDAFRTKQASFQNKKKTDEETKDEIKKAYAARKFDKILQKQLSGDEKANPMAVEFALRKGIQPLERCHSDNHQEEEYRRMDPVRMPWRVSAELTPEENEEEAKREASLWEVVEQEGEYPYYYNATTGESCYEQPAAIEYLSSDPSKWSIEVDDNSGYQYYLNSATLESTWEIPPCLANRDKLNSQMQDTSNHQLDNQGNVSSSETFESDRPSSELSFSKSSHPPPPPPPPPRLSQSSEKNDEVPVLVATPDAPPPPPPPPPPPRPSQSSFSLPDSSSAQSSVPNPPPPPPPPPPPSRPSQSSPSNVISLLEASSSQSSAPSPPPPRPSQSSPNVSSLPEASSTHSSAPPPPPASQSSSTSNVPSIPSTQPKSHSATSSPQPVADKINQDSILDSIGNEPSSSKSETDPAPEVTELEISSERLTGDTSLSHDKDVDSSCNQDHISTKERKVGEKPSTSRFPKRSSLNVRKSLQVPNDAIKSHEASKTDSTLAKSSEDDSDLRLDEKRMPTSRFPKRSSLNMAKRSSIENSNIAHASLEQEREQEKKCVERSENDSLVCATSTALEEKTTAELLEQLDGMRFEDFIVENFNLNRKGVGKTQTTIEKISNWKKDLIKLSLLSHPENEVEKASVQVFRNITGYMGDRSTKKSKLQHIRKIYDMCLRFRNARFQDEIYCQICKQTNKNPSLESTLRGWEMMMLCLAVFPPSPKLMLYLMVYCAGVVESVKSNDPKVLQFAEVCLHSIPKIVSLGTQTELPSDEDCEKIMEGNITYQLKSYQI